MGGYSALDSTAASNAAMIYLVLDPFDKRLEDGVTQYDVVDYMRKSFFALQEEDPLVVPRIFGFGHDSPLAKPLRQPLKYRCGTKGSLTTSAS